MNWEDTRDHLLAMTPRLPREVSSVRKTGVYAWWDLSGAIAFPASFPSVSSSTPLYVGLAKKKSLADRVVDMHLKTTRMSGLRRTLAALLRDELDLLEGVTAHPGRKLSLSSPYEERLTKWMQSNLRITWVLHAAPSEVEKEIINDLLPPLNTDFAHRGEFWVHTDRLRAQLHADASAARRSHGL